MAEINETLTSIYDNAEDMGEYLLTALKVLETDILGGFNKLDNQLIQILMVIYFGSIVKKRKNSRSLWGCNRNASTRIGIYKTSTC